MLFIGDRAFKSSAFFIAALIGASLALLALGYFRMRFALVNAFDTGIYLQLLSNLSSGRGWESSVTGEGNFLTHHFQPSLVMAWPFFGAVPNAFGLFFLSAACVGAAARFFRQFLIGQLKLNPLHASLLALPMLLYPSTATRLYYGFVPEVLALPFLVFQLPYFFKTEPLGKKDFIILCFLQLVVAGTKETAWLVNAAVWLGLGSVPKRSRLLLAALNIAIFIFLFFYWMPAQSSHQRYYGLSYYQHAWIDPVLPGAQIFAMLLNLFSAQSLETLAWIFGVLGVFFPIFSRHLVLLPAVPTLLLILGASQPQVQKLGNHYLLFAIPFLLAATSLGWQQFCKRRHLSSSKATMTAALPLLTTLLVTLGMGGGVLNQIKLFKEDFVLDVGARVEQIRALIPKSSSIIVDSNLQPFFFDYPQSKTTLSFTGNPVVVGTKELMQSDYLITALNPATIQNCAELVLNDGSNEMQWNEEAFQEVCAFLKSSNAQVESFERGVGLIKTRK